MSQQQSTTEVSTDLASSAETYDITGNPKRYVRLGMAMIIIGFGGFLLWSSLAKLDEGTPAPATVVVASQPKPVQHLSGGIVSQVLVTEGQYVNKDDVIFEIDQTQANANFESAQHQWYALLAQQARLIAEKQGLNRIDFPEDLLNADKQPNGNPEAAKHYMDLQKDVFNSRKLSLQSELSVLDQSALGIQAQISGTQSQLQSKKLQAEIINNQLTKSRELAKQGYLPMNKLNEEERQASDINAQMLDAQATLVRLNSNLSEIKGKREQRLREFTRDVETQLAEISNQVATNKERVIYNHTELTRTTVKAPASGQIIGLVVQSPGAVISPGMKLAEIVPTNEQMLLDAQIPLHLIDRIHPGMEADIRFHGLTDFQHLSVEGKVLSVSTDKLTDPNTRIPYYLARVAISEKGMQTLGNRTLQAGMPAELMIITRERTALEYFIEPLRKRLSSSMREH